MEQKGQNECFCTENTLSISEILFAEGMLPEEIILNEVSLGGSPKISATLGICLQYTLPYTVVDWVEYFRA